MKAKVFTTLMIATIMVSQGLSQDINWKRLTPEQKNIVTINTGLDNGVVVGAGYSHQFTIKIPVLVNGAVSVPAGTKLLEDFKVKLGAQANILKLGDFRFIVAARGIYRRFENPFVRLQNFGSEFVGALGYYRSRWFSAGEFGFDKAIVTHFKHSELYRDVVYEDVRDGWYQPSTGGNFIYGLQSGYSFNKGDLVLKAGKVIQQDLRTKPSIPFYVQLSYSVKF